MDMDEYLRHVFRAPDVQAFADVLRGFTEAANKPLPSYDARRDGEIVIMDEVTEEQERTMGTWNGEASTEILERNAALLREQAAAMEIKAALIKKLGDDVYEMGDVLCWKIRIGGGDATLTYVALKIDEHWYTSSRYTTKRVLGWSGLIAFMLSQGELVDVVKMRAGKSLLK